MIGRFAPSPTGPLHLGNLRTALLAWLLAQRTGGHLLLRFEDLDRANSSRQNERRQLDELAALGIDHQGEVLRQSERFDLYGEVLDDLRDRDLVYPCYCSRREIREAIRAPHGSTPDGVYPGTCRTLGHRERSAREEAGRTPAWRLRASAEEIQVDDALCGPTVSVAEDIVLQRNDGVPAYNLAVVVDDAAQEVTQVVRGADLLAVTGGQIHLQRLLGYATPQYAHVPLVLGPDGERLSKRHGAVTLEDLASAGTSSTAVLGVLGRSLGCDREDPRSAADLLGDFDPGRVPRTPWTVPEHWQTGRP